MTTGILDRIARTPDAVVRYGPLDLHIADVYCPPGASLGVVVLLHGGFWRNRYDRVHLRPLAEAIARGGYSVALPEYRRVGDAGGGVPGTFDDAVLAIRELPRLISEGRAMDAAAASATTVIGHSAGGHLAVWAGASAAGASGPALRIVSLAGVLDLAEALALDLSSGAVRELLGTEAVGFASRLRDADPMRLPVPSGPGTTVTVIHGTADDEVPSSFSTRYASRSELVRSRIIDGAGHYDLIDPLTEAFPVVMDALAG
jgi:acetyl esterase/lipase